MTHCGRIRVASTFFERLAGLLRRQLCRNGETLLLMPCSCIHTFGMGEAIDVAFVNPYGRVVFAARDLPPKRLLSCRGAVGTLERRADPETGWYEIGELVRLVSTGPR